jgi:hypothetical protein
MEGTAALRRGTCCVRIGVDAPTVRPFGLLLIAGVLGAIRLAEARPLGNGSILVGTLHVRPRSGLARNGTPCRTGEVRRLAVPADLSRRPMRLRRIVSVFLGQVVALRRAGRVRRPGAISGLVQLVTLTAPAARAALA